MTLATTAQFIMGNPFLNSRQARMMKRDWKNILRSEDAVQLTLVRIKRSNGPGSVVTDPIYNTPTGGSLVTEDPITFKAMMELVTPQRMDILKWEVMQVGDAILYVDNEEDLNFTIDTSVTGVKSVKIADPAGQVWVPLITPISFAAFCKMRLGVVGQFAQVIPVRLISESL